MQLDVGSITLEGERVRLEPLQLSHHSRLCEIGLNPALWKATIIRVESAAQMHEYIESALNEQTRGVAMAFVIVDKSSNQVVGTTRYHHINPSQARLEIGYTWIAPEWQRTGINREAKLLLLQKAFEDYDCERVEFKASKENQQSRDALVKLGAKQEGILRSYALTKDGAARDVVLFSITKEEWPAVKASLTRRRDRGNDSGSDYNGVAAEYAEHFKDELADKEFDRKMLDWLAEKIETDGPVCDMGCGPGQVARYLHDRALETCGIDLSGEMVRHARELNPDISFEVGDMLDLNKVSDHRFSAVAAFYSIVHFPPAALPAVFAELKRVLAPRGILLLTHHIGTEVVHREELFGKPVDLDFRFFETQATADKLEQAGFILEEVIERNPYPEVEYQSRRAYIFARRP